ncbi:hypothetical protein EYF80_010778 [Liparis tanakae]|uniref:Uncharacterized protein n=1 Tax=Liparis tanakae TaxID=230148 RepID=A0A4Z2IM42_9TELE|nr:hypothetical protein EYF80_010778 [Liparis tanakae]
MFASYSVVSSFGGSEVTPARLTGGERREARGERREARGERREARGERREARGERREASSRFLRILRAEAPVSLPGQSQLTRKERKSVEVSDEGKVWDVECFPFLSPNGLQEMWKRAAPGGFPAEIENAALVNEKRIGFRFSPRFPTADPPPAHRRSEEFA